MGSRHREDECLIPIARRNHWGQMFRRKSTKIAITERFEQLKPSYEQLGLLVSDAIRSLLRKELIDILDVTFRVKTLVSFLEKIRRKRYENPYDEICDICGVRIVCFYPSDLEKIARLIQSEFVVIESSDKADLLEPDRFGYRSQHFIVKLKAQWLETPQYRDLGDLKFEIQIRTIMMHAWAGLSHKLAYKKKEQVPNQFLRRLFQLSALFEVADEQFDVLQSEKSSYQDRVRDSTDASAGFDVHQPLNVDTLQAFLDYNFADRLGDHDFTADLLEEITQYHISIRDLVIGHQESKPALEVIEKNQLGSDDRWAQVGVLRTVLELTNDDYWAVREQWMPKEERTLKLKWRKQIRKDRK